MAANVFAGVWQRLPTSKQDDGNERPRSGIVIVVGISSALSETRDFAGSTERKTVAQKEVSEKISRDYPRIRLAAEESEAQAIVGEAFGAAVSFA